MSPSDIAYRAVHVSNGHLAGSKNIVGAFRGAVLSNANSVVIGQAEFIPFDLGREAAKNKALGAVGALGVLAGVGLMLWLNKRRRPGAVSTASLGHSLPVNSVQTKPRELADELSVCGGQPIPHVPASDALGTESRTSFADLADATLVETDAASVLMTDDPEPDDDFEISAEILGLTDPTMIERFEIVMMELRGLTPEHRSLIVNTVFDIVEEHFMENPGIAAYYEAAVPNNDAAFVIVPLLEAALADNRTFNN